MTHVIQCDGCAEVKPCSMKIVVLQQGGDRDCLYLCEECYYKY